jgi:hypothetical protein
MAVTVPPPRIGKDAGSMAKLSTKARKRLKPAEFAGPDRSYPIEDASHARNALSRVANKSPALKARVRSAAHRKYPGIDKPGLINR